MNFNIPEFSVSEFSRSIKRLVEDAFGYVRIKGEITGFKRASSGHLYFSLKDENSTLSSVCFRNMAQLIDFEIGDGLQVIASGRITTYEGRSNYQIIVEKLEIAGIGAILEMIEKRRQKLLAEGLFDEIHKKPIPFLPKIIGVITSETGAVIEDIKHRIEARFPTHIVLYSTLVQGDKAAAEITRGVKFFNSLKGEKRPDVLIIARGGGSFEDLLPFNDEALVREVFKSEIPVISAVGHETDTTLIDYVSDLRAPTPTAAAELVTPVLSELKNQLNFLQDRLNFLPNNFLSEQETHLRNLQRYIVDPARTLDQIGEKFFVMSKRLDFSVQDTLAKKSEKISAMQISEQMFFRFFDAEKQKISFLSQGLDSTPKRFFDSSQSQLKNLSQLLKNSSYKEILKRGFAVVHDQDGRVISAIEYVDLEQKITVEMSDGKIEARVDKIA